MWQRLDIQGGAELRDPVLLVCLSTMLPQYRALYSQGRELGAYLLKNVKFKPLATLFASALPPGLMISEEGEARLVSLSFHYSRGDPDIVLLTGDTTPTDEQHQLCDAVIAHAKKLGVKRLVSFGARWTEAVAQPGTDQKAQGFATDEEGVRELEKYGVTILRDEVAPFFASTIVAIAGLQGIRGYKISVDHGEPIPHPKALIKFLDVLEKMLKLEVDCNELTLKAEQMKTDLGLGKLVEPSRERSGIYG